MPELKTTFIPKKTAPTVSARAPQKPVNIFVIGAVIIFLLSLTIAGGLYLYRSFLLRDINTLSQSVQRAEESKRS